MNLRTTYLLLLIAGLITPNIVFVPWVLEHGWDIPRFFAELFANRISTAFALDLILSMAALIVFAFTQRKRVRHWWMPVAAGFIGGLCVGLPLLLYLRESNGGSKS